MTRVIGSIVVFNPKINLLIETIESFFASYNDSIFYIWDNSPVDKISNRLKDQFSDRIIYNTFNKNLGFGRGHNNNFKLAQNKNFDFFCILNPDLIIPKESIPKLIEQSSLHPKLGLFSGNIYGTDGVLHHVHKRFPTFKSYFFDQLNKIFKTKFFPVENFAIQIPADGPPKSVPVLSGCFLFFTKDHYEELNGFDERFFLYFEDYDLTYRSYLMNKSAVHPNIKIIHHWQRDSHKNLNLRFIHALSGFKFYWKWFGNSRGR